MCGISGIISLNGEPVRNLDSRIESMTKALHHRGPDQSGIYISKKRNCALSNNRLSIVGVNEKIDLPFTKNKKDFLSFNGEIYNYLEIKKLLQDEKINFITKTDTEVLYEYIKNFHFNNFNKINGMWSFAYYNEKKHELTLCRDLMGERHLFYTIKNNELIFSSEVKPILSVLPYSSNLDFESIIASWKYNSALPGKTLVKDILRMKPGTRMLFSNNKIKTEQIQKLHPEKWFGFFKRLPSIETVDKKFEEIFSHELNLRIPNEIKFFTTISGGIDSSVLGHFIKESSNKNFNSLFLISSLEQKLQTDLYNSEIQTSARISKEFGFSHSLIALNEKDKIFEDLVSFASNCFDGCIDAGVINFSNIAKFIKTQSAKAVMLSEGPDEFLGGYPNDIESHTIDKMIGPNSKLGFLRFLSKNNLGKFFLINLMKLKKNIEFENTYKPFYSKPNNSVCSNKFLNSIIEKIDFEKIHDFGTVDLIYKNITDSMDFSQIRALNYASKVLPDMYNLRTDKAFMSQSVEARLPFQSISLAEFFIAMPDKYRFYMQEGNKNKIKQGKFFLRQYLSKKIKTPVSSLVKRGFGVNLWREASIYRKLNMEEEIKNSSFFKEFPFKKNIQKTLLSKNTHPGNLWAAYCFIKTHNNLKSLV
jgi:asparagine synthase (glutamine-hydrolysing)